MGWARTMLLGDVGNRLDIDDCEANIKELKIALMQMHREDQSQDLELNKLRRENDELKLYLAAVVRLLTSKGVVTTEEVQKMVEAIDAEDGAMDGRMRSGGIVDPAVEPDSEDNG